ncbi:transporter substrate-binding domain-containing protein [Burkholderia pseudomallei]|uniref:transporter substrate-binding domain-containing protein n=1 Tax=Burkholderia pseudomallei TaxID=28450 RepID=UPI00014F94E1|nr:bacterial extracellular solute-binding s, 3 family protein [Burkholderia pseudomallei]EBA50649.1 ABC amino acid transporter, periplasmic ligand binding protein [Burkholderia pseudomallei 305]KGW58425.1 bacterial extracellular solute-binding s, 3 family protein [Burkholderia pseudomallei MSHR303]MBM5620720.1 transporter substrate-binding domain-containing protein [Burkholderia pseudomallei]MBM5634201.1 transporter substrate-binding domain-containing protein [Burkholderia pseudomallei]
MNTPIQTLNLVQCLARTAVTLLLASVAGLSLFAPQAHADALDTIAKSGIVRIGVFEDYPPFGSIGPDMKPQGYDIDVASLIGKALNAKVELVQVTGDNRMAYLADHKTDMLLSVGETPERAKVIDFSQPYAPYYLAVFGPKSLAVKNAGDLAGKTVAVARGTLEDLSVSKVAPASAVIKRFDDPNGAISAFLSGQAQLLVVGNDVGATIMARHPANDPEQKFSLFSSPDHVGLNKNEPRLKQKVNEAIANAKKDGTMNAISQKWLRAPLPADL